MLHVKSGYVRAHYLVMKHGEKKAKSKMYDTPGNAVEGFHIKVFNTLFYLKSMVLWLDLPVCFIALESYYFLKYIFLKRNTNA